MFNFILSAINKTHLIKSLTILWQGLVAIIIVIGCIMIATMIMNKIANRKKNDDNKKE